MWDACTEWGLQRLIDTAKNFLFNCEILPNVGKCASTAIKNITKGKQSVINRSVKFNIRGAMMPSLETTEKWKYLGIVDSTLMFLSCWFQS